MEQDAKRQPEPLSRDELETCYFALIDLLTSNFPIDEMRRARLKALVSRMSEHARHLESIYRSSSGLRKRMDPSERQAVIRSKLLQRRSPGERGTWAIYAEGISDEQRQLLLTVIEGTYAEAVERALNEPGFITDGMGGQIDLLGIEPSQDD